MGEILEMVEVSEVTY